MAWVQLGMNSARMMTIGVVRALGWPQGSRGLCSGGNTLSPTYLPAEAGEPWTNGGRGLKAGCQFVYGLKTLIPARGCSVEAERPQLCLSSSGRTWEAISELEQQGIAEDP